jgi:hypothetical protein
MADYQCPNPVRGVATRWTRADLCGTPVSDAVENSRLTTRAFISATFKAELENGAEIVQKRADGSICVTDKAPDALKRLTAEVKMCGYPVPMMQLALSMNAFVDPDDPTKIIGAALASRDQQAQVEATETLQVEAWQINKDAASCSGGGGKPYVRNIFPLCRNRQISGTIDVEQGKASELAVGMIVEEAPGYRPSDDADATMNATNIATMQRSGPWGFFVEANLPTIRDCQFDPVGSGSGL